MTFRPIFRPRNLLLGSFVLLAGLASAYRWLNPPYTPQPLPVPNGYDDLVRAAEMLAPRTSFYGEMDEEELKATVTQNQAALQLAREAMRKEYAVPLNWQADQDWYFKVQLPRSNLLRELARAFVADAKQAAADGNTARAIRCGIDTIHLGQATAKGGLFTDWLIGHVIHGRGLHLIRAQVDRLTQAECDSLLQELSQIESGLELRTEVIRREKAFFRATSGMTPTIFMQIAGVKQNYPPDIILNHSRTQLKLLKTHLAIRRFQLMENRLPETLGELNLPNVTKDPCSDGSFIYRSSAEGYTLYGVGSNGVDDGATGKPGWQTRDWMLENE